MQRVIVELAARDFHHRDVDNNADVNTLFPKLTSGSPPKRTQADFAF